MECGEGWGWLGWMFLCVVVVGCELFNLMEFLLIIWINLREVDVCCVDVVFWGVYVCCEKL